MYAYKEYGRVAAFDQDGLESKLPDQALLSLGVSLMKEGRYDRALVYFDQVVSIPGSLLADHAEWYMILTKMASGGPMDLSALSRIAQDTGPRPPFGRPISFECHQVAGFMLFSLVLSPLLPNLIYAQGIHC